MLSEISSELFAEWMAYERMEPWGEVRADLRAGIIAATVANGARAKGAKAFSPQDFMPRYEEETEEEARERLEAQVFAALGGRR